MPPAFDAVTYLSMKPLLTPSPPPLLLLLMLP